MKKLLHIFLFLVIVLGLAACHKPAEISFDPSLLYGKWQEGSVYERYYASAIERVLPNGDTVQVNGTTWDVSDDVTEEDAQLFNWTLKGATLKHEHVGTFVTVPKVYTIIMLGSNNLVYNDEYGVTHHYSKVN